MTTPALTTVATVATAATAVACAASGGALLAFSTVVPAALARLSPAEGLAAMQAVNVAAPRSPLFMALLFLPAAAAGALAVRHVVTGQEAHAALLVSGAAVQLVGVVGTTVLFHVPRNDALAVLGPADAAGFAAWLEPWVLGNHVRAAAGLVAGGLLALSLR